MFTLIAGVIKPLRRQNCIKMPHRLDVCAAWLTKQSNKTDSGDNPACESEGVFCLITVLASDTHILDFT